MPFVFDPVNCPECGERTIGTREVVPGTALMYFDAIGNAAYAGETELDWNEQKTQRASDGRVLLTCHNAHIWPALQTQG